MIKKEILFDQLSEKTVNIGFKAKNETEQILSNLAPTPFKMDGENYASVEGFWQGLKFPETSEQRKEIAKLSGVEAKKAGRKAINLAELEYQGEKIKVGSEKHQSLIKRAIKAKLEQNPNVLKLLLDTNDKKITHILKDPKDGRILPDSKTIPGEKFCQILMDLREEFRNKNQF